MKIYFAGSIRGGRRDADIYRQLINCLKSYGTVLTEHVGGPLSESEKSLPVEFIYQRDRRWIEESDVLVADISQPSTGVGYEIGLAESLRKPMLCLYRSTSQQLPSAMIAGNAGCALKSYTTIGEAEKYIHDYFSEHQR